MCLVVAPVLVVTGELNQPRDMGAAVCQRFTLGVSGNVASVY